MQTRSDPQNPCHFLLQKSNLYSPPFPFLRWQKNSGSCISLFFFMMVTVSCWLLFHQFAECMEEARKIIEKIWIEVHGTQKSPRMAKLSGTLRITWWNKTAPLLVHFYIGPGKFGDKAISFNKLRWLEQKQLEKSKKGEYMNKVFPEKQP